MQFGDTQLVDAAHEERAADVAALLADGADVNEVDETGWTALGTAAFLVLEAAKPWSRKTHKYFPAPARARAVELLRVGQWFKRLPSDFPIPFEVWEAFVMPHMVTRDYQPPQAA